MGHPLFDKYLGDALYAAMVYAILRLFTQATLAALYAVLIMTALELFQLTQIPVRWFASQYWPLRIFARLLGLHFGLLDLLAYAVGIAGIHLAALIRNGWRRTPADTPESRP